MVVLESSRHIALLRLGYAVDIWDLAIATVPTSRWLSFQGIKVIVICEHKKIMEIANTYHNEIRGPYMELDLSS